VRNRVASSLFFLDEIRRVASTKELRARAAPWRRRAREFSQPLAMALLASGQVTTSSTPTPLSATPMRANQWQYKAMSSNTSQVGVGPAVQYSGAALSMSNAHLMDPGDYETIDNTVQQGAVVNVHPSDVYVVGTGGVIAWMAFG
jgi:hypothetical protein